MMEVQEFKPEIVSVDISQAPDTVIEYSDVEITIGDLHANPLVALFMDLYYGLAELENQDYQMLYQLSRIYESLSPKTKSKQNEEVFEGFEKFECIKRDTLSLDELKKLIQYCEQNETEIKKYEEEQYKKKEEDNEVQEQFKKLKKIKIALASFKKELLQFKKFLKSEAFTEFQQAFLKAEGQFEKIEVVKNYFFNVFDKISYKKGEEKKIFTRYIGDETGDRWLDDELMLEYFKRKLDGGYDYEILASNHGMEFLKVFFNDFNIAFSVSQYRSIYQLYSNISKKDDVYKEKIKDLVRKYYLPKLKALSYTLVLDEKGKTNGIVLHTHAPVPLNIIRKLASDYKVEYKDKTPEELAGTIDEINKQFVAELGTHFFEEKYNTAGIDNGNCDFNSLEIHSIVQLCWQRHLSLYQASDGVTPLRPAEHNGYKVFYDYGHDNMPTQQEIKTFPKNDPEKIKKIFFQIEYEQKQGHIFPLNSYLGYSANGNVDNEGELKVVVTPNRQKPTKEIIDASKEDIEIKKGLESEGGIRSIETNLSKLQSINEAYAKIPLLHNSKKYGYFLSKSIESKETKQGRINEIKKLKDAFVAVLQSMSPEEIVSEKVSALLRKSSSPNKPNLLDIQLSEYYIFTLIDTDSRDAANYLEENAVLESLSYNISNFNRG